MKTPIPYAVAMITAQSLAAELRPFTTQLEIVGSLRRGKATVGDIELLYIPRFEQRRDGLFDEFQFNLAEWKIGHWLTDQTLTKRPNVRGHFAWGEKNKLALHSTGTPVDLFATTEENWPVSLVIRTGSKETNLRLTTGAQKQGGTLHAYGCGVSYPDGRLIRAVDERHVFALCGVPYLHPHER